MLGYLCHATMASLYTLVLQNVLTCIVELVATMKMCILFFLFTFPVLTHVAALVTAIRTGISFFIHLSSTDSHCGVSRNNETLVTAKIQ